MTSKEQIVGRAFENNTRGFLEEDGNWKVTVVITEKITFDGQTWIEESIDCMGIDTDFDAAHQTALRALLQYLEGEIYAKGYKSLVEFRIDKELQELSYGAEANNYQNSTP